MKNRFGKIIVVMAMLSLIAAMFAGCGAKTEAPVPSAQEPVLSVSEEENLPMTSDIEYPGAYMDGQDDTVCNKVEITENDDHTFAMVISINRLTTFEATGSMMDGAVEFVTEDPNGEVMYGIFYPDEKPSEDAEQTFTLKFTESSWDLLETDTEFPLFVKLPE